MAEYKSVEVTVNAAPMEIFNRLTDINGFLQSVPEEYRKDISVDGDTLSLCYAGFTIAIRLAEKVPFSKVAFCDVEAPFHFTVTFNLSPASLISQTVLSIGMEAELNFMMKSLLGGKIKEFLDKAATTIASGALIA